jgi:hypothetical protein
MVVNLSLWWPHSIAVSFVLFCFALVSCLLLSIFLILLITCPKRIEHYLVIQRRVVEDTWEYRVFQAWVGRMRLSDWLGLTDADGDSDVQAAANSKGSGQWIPGEVYESEMIALMDNFGRMTKGVENEASATVKQLFSEYFIENEMMSIASASLPARIATDADVRPWSNANCAAFKDAFAAATSGLKKLPVV